MTNPLLFDPNLQETQLALDDAIANERWDQARDLALTELHSIRDVELTRNIRLHKGHALYNLGVVVFGESPAESRRFVMAARVEDARTYRSIPGEAVAGRVLRELFRFSSGLISGLTRVARRRPAEDPEQVAADFAANHLLPPLPTVPHADSRPTAELEAIPLDQRIFLGGNYSRCFDRIYNAREVIVEAGLQPIIVREFESLPGELIRAKSFRVLDACQTVVFEGSDDGGWVPELDRLSEHRPDTPTLIVFQHEDPDGVFRGAMVRDIENMPNLSKQPYQTNGEMRYKLLRWLKRLTEPHVRGFTTPTGPMFYSSPLPPHIVTTSGTPLPGSASPTVEPDDSGGSTLGKAGEFRE